MSCPSSSMGRSQVSVRFEEVGSQDWAEKVYRPDIKAKWGQLSAKSLATRCNKREELAVNISFENKVALVTGAGSGLGLATAKAFAESGASVVLADWHEKSVRAAAAELTARGHKALAIRLRRR